MLVRPRWLFLPVSLLPFVLVLNMFTINDFPSWWDESFMANIAFNFSTGHGLFLDLNPSREGVFYSYGPVFFYLQSLLIGLVGFDAFWYRIPNLLAAYLTLILLALIMRGYGITRAYVWIFLLLALVDFSINRNMISGRMDMVAVLFVMSAFYIGTLSSSKMRRIDLFKWSIVGGILCSRIFNYTPSTISPPFCFRHFGASNLFSYQRLINLASICCTISDYRIWLTALLVDTACRRFCRIFSALLH